MESMNLLMVGDWLRENLPRKDGLCWSLSCLGGVFNGESICEKKGYLIETNRKEEISSHLKKMSPAIVEIEKAENLGVYGSLVKAGVPVQSDNDIVLDIEGILVKII